MVKIAITGHANIEKAFKRTMKHPNGVKYNLDVFDSVYEDISSNLSIFLSNNQIDIKDVVLISGMARGVDEVFAIYAIRNNIPLILSIPHSQKWHQYRDFSRGIRSQAIYYEKILSYSNILTINEVKKQYNGETYKFANFARNQQMIDDADLVFSYKKYESAGTNDAIKRAESVGKYVGDLSKPI